MKHEQKSVVMDGDTAAAYISYAFFHHAEKAIAGGERDAAAIRGEMLRIIEAEPLAVPDYVEIVDWELLQPVRKLEKPALVAVAVKFGKTRLIDNYIWE